MAHLWRDWKYRVKKRGYYAYETDEKRLANCPPSEVQEQWITLVAKWGKDEVEKKIKINKENRSKQGLLHITGKKQLSVLKKQRSMYIASRTDKDGHAKDRTGDHIIEKLIDAINELPEDDRNSPTHREKIFVEHFGKDGYGRMRCMGHGIAPRMVSGQSSSLLGAESAAVVRADLEAKMEAQQLEMEADFEKQI